MTPCGGPAGVEADKTRTELGINYHMVRKESADPKLTVSCGPHCRNTIMKLTKNAAALLLAASLAVSVCATPVFAETDPTATGASASLTTTGADAALSSMKTAAKTDVVYEVGSSYSWSIPSKIDFGSNAGVKKTVKVNANSESQTPANNTNGTDGTAQKVKVEKNTIPVGTSLKISISTDTLYDSTGTSGQKGFYVEQKHQTNNAVEKLYYTIKTSADGTELEHTGEVMKVTSGTATQDQALFFALTTSKGDVEKAGKYAGVLKLVAEVVDDTNP